MKVLGLMGSPRIKGNTDLLLDEALRGARNAGSETEKVLIDKLTIAPCKEYYGCARDGNCVIRDDMDALYDKIVEADVVIVASPMFFYSVSAQTKAVIDRCQALWARKHLLKQTISHRPRRGAFIAVGATKGKNLFEGSLLVMKYFFEAIDVEYAGNLLVRGIDSKAQIKEHPQQLAEAFELGQRLVTQQ